MKKNYLVGLIILLGILLAASIATFISRRESYVSEPPTVHLAPQNPPQEITSLEVAFSHNPGFFAESFYLALFAPEGAAIHFTTDGSPPTAASQQYISPIRVTAPSPALPIAQFDRVTTSRVTVLSINAIAVLGDEISETVTANFVMGTDVHTRFNENTLIFALNSDPHGLFDHYDGILVPGIDRERFRQEYFNLHGRLPEIGYNYGQETPASPANFNRRGMESERAVHVQMFDSGGTLHISQRAGMRVRGGFSRAHEPQKSLELFARDEYGDRNHFLFAFFDEELTLDGQIIDRYRRVRLRNGGSDRYAGFIRDELSHTLFRQAGHPDTQSHVPAAVFLNGDFHGVAWLKSPRTENHLQRRYGGVTNNFEIVEGGDNRFVPSWWDGEERAVNDLLEIGELAKAGFTGADGQARFEEFSRRVDIDNLIRYYAMQIYINNYDWPNHNIEMWRYFPTESEKNDPNLHPYLRDGRWRVFAHDLEATWSIWDDENRMAREDTIRDIITGENDLRWNSRHSSAFFFALVNRGDTKAQIANTFVDLIEGAFAPENIIDELSNLILQIETEHNHAMRINVINPESGWWPTVESVANSRDAIRRFAWYRPNYILLSIQANFGFHRDARFSVNLTTGAGGGVIMNSRPVPELRTARANYFVGTSIRITAVPNAGYEIDYWIVNGVRKTGEVVAINENSDVSIYFRRTQ